jgi:hypothetical protein
MIYIIILSIILVIIGIISIVLYFILKKSDFSSSCSLKFKNCITCINTDNYDNMKCIKAENDCLIDDSGSPICEKIITIAELHCSQNGSNEYDRYKLFKYDKKYISKINDETFTYLPSIKFFKNIRFRFENTRNFKYTSFIYNNDINTINTEYLSSTTIYNSNYIDNYINNYTQIAGMGVWTGSSLGHVYMFIDLLI